MAALQHMEFLGHGSDLSCCSNIFHAESLTSWAGLGIEPASQLSRDTADPLCHSKDPDILNFNEVQCIDLKKKSIFSFMIFAF